MVTRISTLEGLDSIRDDVSGDYILDGNIDASDTETWNGGSGWDPISDFEGTFDGNGHVIEGLYIDRDGKTGVGLFGMVAESDECVIRNVVLKDVDITGGNAVGAAVGSFNGTPENRPEGEARVVSVQVSGSITADGGPVGGVAGRVMPSSNPVTIENCRVVSAEVRGNSKVGGIVGDLYGGDSRVCTLTNSNFNGTVGASHELGNTGDQIAGIAGNTYYAKFVNCHSSCEVDAPEADNVCGGISYLYDSTVKRCSAQGTINAGEGGIGGFTDSASNTDISQCSADVDITSNMGGDMSEVGGFVSHSYGTKYEDCSVEGTITDDNGNGGSIGGFAGYYGGYEITSSNIFVSVEITQSGFSDAGEFVGDLSTNTFENCLLNGDNNSDLDPSPEGSITGVSVGTESQCTGTSLPSVTSNWNFENNWYAMESEYPGIQSSLTIGISTADELDSLPKQMLGANFVLQSDIDLSGMAYKPAGHYTDYNNKGFCGTFDGNGYTIKNLNINKTTDDSWNSFLGIFSEVENAVLKNVTIEGGYISGGSNCGLMAGQCFGDTWIYNVNTKGEIDTAWGDNGGVVGDVYDNTRLERCTSEARVASTDSRNGGLIGTVYGSTKVLECEAHGNVEATDNAGGLIGQEGGGTTRIERCKATGDVRGGQYVGGFCGMVSGGGYWYDNYSTGSVTGTGGNFQVGGWAGSVYYYDIQAVERCFGTGETIIEGGHADGPGGFVGEWDTGGNSPSDPFADCYWDTESTGVSTDVGSLEDGSDYTSSGITGLTTSEMQGGSSEKNMTTLDFGGTWTTTGAYPELVLYYDPVMNLIVRTLSWDGDAMGGEAISINETLVAETDENGEYSAQLEPEGSYVIGWPAYEMFEEVQGKVGETVVDLQLANITGTVLDVDGEPVEDDVVVLNGRFMAETDSQGVYSIENIPAREYAATWVNARYEDVVDATDGGEIPNDYQYAGIEVSVEHPLMDKPIENAIVGIDGSMFRTDETGKVRFPKARMKKYIIQAMGFWETETLKLTQGTLHEEVFSGGDMEISVGVDVYGPNGQEPMEGVDILITGPDVMGETDSNGHAELFAANLRQSPELVVAADDPRYQTMFREIDNTKDREDFELTLEPREPMER